MINVYWDAFEEKSKAFRVLINAPIHALTNAPRGDHLRCPALQDYYRNAFNIITPFTSGFKDDGVLVTSGDDVLMDVKKYEDRMLIQIYPSYVFYTDEEVMLQLTPPHLVKSLPVIHVAGEFNIKHWIRPVQPTFMIDKELQINEGMAIAGLRFITQNNESVKLVRKTLSEGQRQCLEACKAVTSVKNSGNQLTDLYDKFDNLKQSLIEKG